MKETFPVGKTAEASKSEQKLPALEVKNRVAWINADVELPVDLRVGHTSKLGLFFTPRPEREEKDSVKQLRVHPYHHRSALVGRFIFKDKQGRLYRDLDIKGGGFVRTPTENVQDAMIVQPMPDVREKMSPAGPYGITRKQNAEKDARMTEMFLEKGMRTCRVVAIIDLLEVVDAEGKRISLDEARERNLIRYTDQPVMEVRAFTTKMRVENLETEPRHLDDAMALVAGELGREKITPDEYMAWFCRTLGEQVARLHNLGYAHGYLTSNNITLDCKIVDFDGAIAWDQTPQNCYSTMGSDKDMLQNTIKALAKYVAARLGVQDPEYYAALALSAYESNVKHRTTPPSMELGF